MLSFKNYYYFLIKELLNISTESFYSGTTGMSTLSNEGVAWSLVTLVDLQSKLLISSLHKISCPQQGKYSYRQDALNPACQRLVRQFYELHCLVIQRLGFFKGVTGYSFHHAHWQNSWANTVCIIRFQHFLWYSECQLLKFFFVGLIIFS